MRRLLTITAVLVPLATVAWTVKPEQPATSSSLELEETKIRFEVFRISGLDISDKDQGRTRAMVIAELLKEQGWEVNSVTDYNGHRGPRANNFDSRVGKGIGSQRAECVMHVVYPEAEKSNTIVVTC
jgi:hypothetical protein